MNYFAPDGYRYGVMFNDGSVGEWFNGRTQRIRNEAKAKEIIARQIAWCGRHDNIRVVRRLSKDTEWEEVCEFS